MTKCHFQLSIEVVSHCASPSRGFSSQISCCLDSVKALSHPRHLDLEHDEFGYLASALIQEAEELALRLDS